jgi:hypothetical protein
MDEFIVQMGEIQFRRRGLTDKREVLCSERLGRGLADGTIRGERIIDDGAPGPTVPEVTNRRQSDSSAVT